MGLNYKEVQRIMNGMQEAYDQLITVEVPKCQENAIKVICDNWNSTLAVEQITKLVNKFNTQIVNIEENLDKLFITISNLAISIMMAEGENGNKIATNLKKKNTRFENLSASVGTYGGINCDRKLVSEAYGICETYVQQGYKRCIDELESLMYQFPEAMDYNNYATELRAKFVKICNKLDQDGTTAINGIKKYANEFNQWADENNVKEEKLTWEIDDDFFGIDTGEDM